MFRRSVRPRVAPPVTMARFPSSSTFTSFLLDLFWACSAGDLELVRVLLQSGMSACEANYDYRTPLHLAVAEVLLGL